jgi:hypothetical protein
MSQKIDLEQLASFLKDRKKKKKKQKKKKKKEKEKEKEKSKFKFVDSDTRQARQDMIDKFGIRANIRDSNLVDGKRVAKFLGLDSKAVKVGSKDDLDTRSGIINKLGIQENVTDSRKEPAYDKLKKRAVEGSLNLIYALQKDVKDIQNRFMFGPIQPQERPVGVRGQSSQTKQQTGFASQDRNASFDLAIKAQTEAREIKKNQDRIEKEAKAEVKRLEAEAKAEVKRLEKEAKDEQARARAEQKALVKEQTKINKELEKQLSEQERKDEEVTRLLKVRADRERAKDQKKQSTITNYTIAQGMRTFTDFAPNPPDIGGGGGLPPLPFNRQRDQYDPLEPAPFYRSTADRIEAPVLQEVLDSISAPPPSEAVEGITMTQEDSEFPPPDDQSMDFMTDEALLGGGASDVTGTDMGGDGMTGEEDQALEEETPAKKKVVVSGEPIVVSGKKKGRPAGSKNKPKPPPSEPSQIARLGGSSVVGRTLKDKTPANSPSASAV